METAEPIKELLEKGRVIIKRGLIANEKLQAKTAALTMSRSINPNGKPNHVNGTLSYQQPEVPPSCENLLKDAQTIYDWLISI